MIWTDRHTYTYLSLGLLVGAEELIIVLLVGPGGEEEGEGGTQGTNDGEDAAVVDAESLENVHSKG